MMDVVVIAMVVVVPVMLYAVRLARQRRFELHKKVTSVTVAILYIAIVGFEIDVRINGWRAAAEPSPFYPGVVGWSLGIHLVFAISTFFLLPVAWWSGRKQYRFMMQSPPSSAPHPHARRHRLLGYCAVYGLCATTVTGWIFYYLAFVAE